MGESTGNFEEKIDLSHIHLAGLSMPKVCIFISFIFIEYSTNENKKTPK